MCQNIALLLRRNKRCYQMFIFSFLYAKYSYLFKRKGALRQSSAMFSNHLVMCSSRLGELFAQCLT